MKILVVVDANVLVSALLGGKPSVSLFDPRFEFVTTRFTVGEVERYLPTFAKKLQVSEATLVELLQMLPVSVYDVHTYQDSLAEARELIGSIDKNDVEILALAMHFETYLWSQDKHFEQAGYQKVLKTYHFIE